MRVEGVDGSRRAQVEAEPLFGPHRLDVPHSGGGLLRAALMLRDRNLGAADAWAAADALRQAAQQVSAAERALDQASGQLGRIAWQPPERQWVTVVFLHGEDADGVLDLIDRDGTDAAIEQLRGFDSGDETTRAALAKEDAYDVPPTDANTRMVTEVEYALTYSPTFGYVVLYRAYTPSPATTTAEGDGPAGDAEAARRALDERRRRVRGDGSCVQTPARSAWPMNARGAMCRHRVLRRRVDVDRVLDHPAVHLTRRDGTGGGPPHDVTVRVVDDEREPRALACGEGLPARGRVRFEGGVPGGDPGTVYRLDGGPVGVRHWPHRHIDHQAMSVRAASARVPVVGW